MMFLEFHLKSTSFFFIRNSKNRWKGLQDDRRVHIFKHVRNALLDSGEKEIEVENTAEIRKLVGATQLANDLDWECPICMQGLDDLISGHRQASVGQS